MTHSPEIIKVISQVYIDNDEPGYLNRLTWEGFVKKPITIRAVKMDCSFEVRTLEGTMKGESGDWLVCGVEDEFYPIKAEIFQKTYERVL